MRHRHGLRKLNRTSSHRLAMLRNMTVSLLKHEAIKTTLPKAKELRRVAEPILTLGKTETLANKRLAFDRLRDRDMVVKLFAELGPRYREIRSRFALPHDESQRRTASWEISLPDRTSASAHASDLASASGESNRLFSDFTPALIAFRRPLGKAGRPERLRALRAFA